MFYKLRQWNTSRVKEFMMPMLQKTTLEMFNWIQFLFWPVNSLLLWMVNFLIINYQYHYKFLYLPVDSLLLWMVNLQFSKLNLSEAFLCSISENNWSDTALCINTFFYAKYLLITLIFFRHHWDHFVILILGKVCQRGWMVLVETSVKYLDLMDGGNRRRKL